MPRHINHNRMRKKGSNTGFQARTCISAGGEGNERCHRVGGEEKLVSISQKT